MGCFLHCFGSSKRTTHRRKARHHHRNASGRPEQPIVSTVQDCSKTVLSIESQVQVKPREQLNASPRKKVTFDSNVKTYEPVLLDEVADIQPEKSEEGGEEETLVKKSSQTKSYSEESSVTSTGSYPTNYRYHNCPDSDGEDGEMDSWDGELTDEDDEEDDDSDMGEEYDELGEDFEDGVVYSRTRVGANQVVVGEVESSIPMCDKDVKSIGLNHNVRDRSVYVHSVLNPVENLTQWKAVKAKRTPPLMSQKENFTLNQKSRTVFDVEPSQKLNQEITVDASLSNWLVSSEATPVNKASSVALCAGTPERSSSQGSNSVISHEDRPILGALTVEELKQFSASSSPRKSPSRGMDEMPISTFGSYSNCEGFAEDSGSATSFKGVTHRASSRGVHLK